jgi:hypothetical protein
MFGWVGMVAFRQKSTKSRKSDPGLGCRAQPACLAPAGAELPAGAATTRGW